MKNELLSVYWYDELGTQHRELYLTGDFTKVEEAVKRLTLGPAARMGMIKRVIITDVLDLTCFEWEDGEVIFPATDGKEVK